MITLFAARDIAFGGFGVAENMLFRSDLALNNAEC
jgi:hypothetical protein